MKAPAPGCWNWNTGSAQNRLPERDCGFESHPGDLSPQCIRVDERQGPRRDLVRQCDVAGRAADAVRAHHRVDDLLQMLRVLGDDAAEQVAVAARRDRLEHLGHAAQLLDRLVEPPLVDLEPHEREDPKAERVRIDLGAEACDDAALEQLVEAGADRAARDAELSRDLQQPDARLFIERFDQLRVQFVDHPGHSDHFCYALLQPSAQSADISPCSKRLSCTHRSPRTRAARWWCTWARTTPASTIRSTASGATRSPTRRSTTRGATRCRSSSTPTPRTRSGAPCAANCRPSTPSTPAAPTTRPSPRWTCRATTSPSSPRSARACGR